MSRTYKDKKLELKYPEWRYDYDNIEYSSYTIVKTHYTVFTLKGIQRLEYPEPKEYTYVNYIKGPTKKLKKKRHYVEKYYRMYSSAPSWWTRLTMNRPKRRACRLWERKVLFQDVETADCPDFKNKPFNYYY